MDSHVIEKISDDVIVHIYKMLDFEDQVRLASTSLSMKRIFENYIRTPKYRTLYIYPNDENPIVTNETQVNKESLSVAGLQEFLKFYAEQIQDLQLFEKIDIELRQFKNLTKLRDVCFQNPLEYLHKIAQDVSNLQCLEFILCFASIAWNVETFLEMKNLKRLSIVYIKPLQYRHFHEMITKLNLEYFKNDSHIEPDKDDFETDLGELVAPTQLKELDIKCTFDRQKWGNNFSTFLKHFENLSTLTLTISGMVTQEVLAQLAETCKNLEKLTINYATFSDIQSFSVAPKLTDLTLGECHGLTYANLKQLLTGTSITKFSSGETRYTGECDGFHLSPLIQKLEIHLIDIRKFEKVLAGNDNLKELKLHSFREYCGNKNTIFSTILASCINVETLHAGWIKLDVDTIVQLKNLHNLYINCYDLAEGGWSSFITTLMKHQPLTTVHLDYSTSNALDLSKITPLAGFSTNITSLHIHFDLFKVCLDFWLDLFSRNREMKLVCSSFFPHEINFLKDLVICEYFPKSLRTIDVFGFSINCHNLRSDPDLTVQKLQTRIEYLDDQFRIILCRTPLALEDKI